MQADVNLIVQALEAYQDLASLEEALLADANPAPVAVESVHVHVWKPLDEQVGSDDDLEFDDDVVRTGTYDDHYQFSVELEDRRVLEIRVSR
jgi:hypothetical protein